MDRFIIRRVGARKRGAWHNPTRSYEIIDLDLGVILFTTSSYEEALLKRRELKSEQNSKGKSISELREARNRFVNSHSSKRNLMANEAMREEVINALRFQTEPLSESQLGALMNLEIEEEYYRHLLPTAEPESEAALNLKTTS
jgi:hypothetical protein